MIWFFFLLDFLDEVTLNSSGFAFLILEFSLGRKDVMWEIYYTESFTKDDGADTLLRMCHGKTSTETIHMINTLEGIRTNKPQQKKYGSHIHHMTNDKWRRTHTTIPDKALYSMREESILIGFTWTSWRFVHAYAGLLVDAMMIAFFACWSWNKMAMREQHQQPQIMAKKPHRL